MPTVWKVLLITFIILSIGLLITLAIFVALLPRTVLMTSGRSQIFQNDFSFFTYFFLFFRNMLGQNASRFVVTNSRNLERESNAFVKFFQLDKPRPHLSEREEDHI
jgi:hypothetical protein